MNHPTHDFVPLGEDGIRCQFCDTNKGGRGSSEICPAALDNAPSRPDIYRPKVLGMVLAADDGSVAVGVGANPITVAIANGATGEGATTTLTAGQAKRLRDLLDQAIAEAGIKRAGEIHLARLALERGQSVTA